MSAKSMRDDTVTPAVLANLSPESRRCVERLAAYQTPPVPDCSPVTTAAVLVAIYERPGIPGLRVLLTIRAKHLRSHPGQTALPGGKCDPTDVDPDFTARREAFEEVALPLGRQSNLHYLTQLAPFISKYKLIVFPVVYFISDPSLLDVLVPSPDEVDGIFDFPLLSCLTASVDGGYELTEKGGPNWPYEAEFHNSSDSRSLKSHAYRMNRFRTSHTPLKGLTSDILIAVSQIGYDLQPQFDRYAAGQLPFDESVKIVVEEARRLPEGEFARRMLARRRSFGTEEEIARLAEIGPSPSEVAEQTIA